MVTNCPNCEKVIELPPDAEGKKVRCADCGVPSRIHATDGGTLWLEALDDEPAPPSAAPGPRRATSSQASDRRPAARRRPPPEPREETRSRPRARRPKGMPGAVVAASVFDLLGGALYGFLAFVALNAWKVLEEDPTLTSEVTPDELKRAGLLLVICSVMFFVLGIGLLTRGAWARILQFILSTFFAFVSLLDGFNLLAILIIILPVSLLVFPGVAEWFAGDDGGRRGATSRPGRRRRRR